MTTAQQLLNRLNEIARNTREQGDLFERFAVAYLKHDEYYGQLFSNIWRWSDWPGRGNETDTGIDIVAEEKETGKLWAIQAKFHEGQLSLNDISTFLALSGQERFSKRMLITTSSLSSNAESALNNQDKPVVVLTLSDLLNSSIDWEQFTWSDPENITLKERKDLYPFQKEAVDSTIKGFKRTNRGKLIMPPGSGKTFVSLKIAEKQEIAGPGGFVFFLAPSIALVEQTLRAWLSDTETPIKVFAVTSDHTVGQEDEYIDRTNVLTIPPTTNAEELANGVQNVSEDEMAVVVSTYHSIDVVSQAQDLGLPEFDVIFADEAHRTTGISDNQDASYYHKVHDEDFIKGSKRLYMTATPRVFVPRLREKVEEQGYEYFTMDDEDTYGEEFFRYGFGQAVDEGFLSDYKVIVFTVDEADVQRKLFSFLNQEDSPEVEEASKIIGVWNALSGRIKDENINAPLKRAVSFTNRIADSKKFASKFVNTIEAYQENIDEDVEDDSCNFDIRHVDGSTTATNRKLLLDWLREEPDPGESKVLSNAQVLKEGIDVPSLDAIVFLRPKRSTVDIVQAVGRAMRKAPGKEYGYVVIPVLVDPEEDAAEQLDNNEEFKKVWQILGALRSIDDRFDAEVRELSIKRGQTGETGESQGSDEDDSKLEVQSDKQTQLTMEDFTGRLFDAILGKLVERVGDRGYLETWAKDVAAASTRIERHINEALESETEYGQKAQNAFYEFLSALRNVINPTVTEEDARSMLVQHIITKPIFDAVFGEYEFLQQNPVSLSFESVADVFEVFVRKETRALDSFYRLVEVRAKGLDKESERQEFLRKLYDTFFKIAFPKTAELLGIVYTPVEAVNFLVKSADAALQDEFGQSLEDEDVVILEPFSGTGTFLAQLMHHISPEGLQRKYNDGEIWGNEILLLPYYIALANIESTYYEITGEYKHFDNLLLVDSFQLMEDRDKPQVELFPEQYAEQMEKQKEAKINVIISNPPWFAWQDDENRGIQSTDYELLDERIEESYAANSSARLKISLFDSYIRAIRMATDRIKGQRNYCFCN
ncbi:DEAD/DEAH box helicase family protein [Natranaerobius thermophilus]|uniref:restriction endonuclease n=1 Tax=Natranaerobius thermophilus TaxID=375929 RepID=UPI00068C78AE|nr:DEAD/DEAH box helicase family protein [Natranaerobius thermophilus]